MQRSVYFIVLYCFFLIFSLALIPQVILMASVDGKLFCDEYFFSIREKIHILVKPYIEIHILISSKNSN